MSQHLLEGIYSDSVSGEIPAGESNGKAIFMPGTLVGRFFSAIDNLLWKGKVVDRSRAGLVNKILGMRIIHAQVFLGPSWSDGKQSIIVDYKKTSRVAFFIRDEIRLVADQLYLGKAYIRLPFGKRFCLLYFALDFNLVRR
jgi:hypothetical protein